MRKDNITPPQRPGEVWAVVTAAGRGARFGGSTPKQYLPLAGRAVLRRAVDALAAHPRIAGVQTVIAASDRALYDAALPDMSPPPVFGGATRQQSVLAGLAALAPRAPQRVLIHDGARPLPSAALIDRVLDALADAPAAMPALPLVDAIRGRDDAGVPSAATLDRSRLLRVQTPQGFDYAAILRAHREKAGAALDDDIAVAAALGLPVAVVAGEEENIKITTADDLRRAEALLSATAVPRVGFGFDAHRFGPGGFVTLCGVRIPHHHGLVGHSDADVGLHALTDALLGAIGAGDIGGHFPPADPQWKNADSARFVEHAVQLVRQGGGRIVNADVTLVCETPAIAPHRGEMTARLAGLLGVAPVRVNVKATTTEGMGFTGRAEGIAAQAVVSVLAA